jgi:NAD(P)-dependent dehydrogenase (short-subunit alcohol dehydrogenase family)
MMERFDFTGRVAIVTGAARGIGRAHAMLLAERGAAVVVNDLGVDVDGTRASDAPAKEVVTEIEKRGGTAVLSFHDVSHRQGAEALVDLALERFGRLDVLLHNAGLNIGPLESIWKVNVEGAWWMVERAWPSMVEQRYGRIVLTTSASGLHGDGTGPHENPKQAYSTSKAAITGLTRSLAMRGRPVDIKVNAVSPKADTRLAQLNRGLTSTRPDAPPPAETLDWGAKHAPPESVAAGTLWLLHQTCPVTGRIFAVGAGRVAEVFVAVTPGYTARDGRLEPEDVLANIEAVCDRRDHYVPIDMFDHSRWARLVVEKALSEGRAELPG